MTKLKIYFLTSWLIYKNLLVKNKIRNTCFFRLNFYMNIYAYPPVSLLCLLFLNIITLLIFISSSLLLFFLQSKRVIFVHKQFCFRGLRYSYDDFSCGKLLFGLFIYLLIPSICKFILCISYLHYECMYNRLDKG